MKRADATKASADPNPWIAFAARRTGKLVPVAKTAVPIAVAARPAAITGLGPRRSGSPVVKTVAARYATNSAVDRRAAWTAYVKPKAIAPTVASATPIARTPAR